MGVIYVNGGYKDVSKKIDRTQDKRIERLESKIDGSDGIVGDSSALTEMIEDNTEKISKNIKDINELKNSLMWTDVNELENSLMWIDVIN